jgi:Ca2+/Na+ antiporter
MFSRKDCIALAIAGALVTMALALMSLDPVENGFGILTLWFAPPLLLTGLALPLLALIGLDNVARAELAGLTRSGVKHLPAVLLFMAAFAAYVATLEPTASLWDCSEFIAAAYKLEVPHTPGGPLSLLVGHMFSMLSLGSVEKVAWSINLMSAFFSALSVAMLYYIICFFCVDEDDRYSRVAMFAGVGGSLCLAFSDTFWFSAVEAETYGPACFFLLLLTWLILTGKHFTAEKRIRRLTMIFYVAGLAYCIHPMCLLALPLVPFVWRGERKMLLRNVVLSLLGGLAIVFVINRVAAIGFFQAAFSFDHFFVNEVHLPFYSGALFFTLLATLCFTFLLRRYAMLRIYLWPAIFLLLGFIPYLMLVVRSNHNPPIDESNPEDLATMKAYMNREGYPSSPLLYGPYFDAKIVSVREKKPAYFKGEDRYEVAGSIPEYEYDSRQTLLPRLYSNDASHIEAYRSWTGLKPNEKPTFTDNISFLLRYQIGHMYLRYLMWNFAGRVGDVQNSDWLRPWERLSDSPLEKARNQYWMIPLLVGLLGAALQLKKNPKGFVAIAILFLINGIILVLYLNSPPNEPRERDYIYVGSYVAFAMWIGLGFAYLGKWLNHFRHGPVVTMFVSLAVPLWMLLQNFDDHDRSGRTFQVDNARNTLNSCAPNSILFTGGDNDTFPLWYLQEVEGFRTDVRVMVLSYMNTDWYINQLRKTYYDSGAFMLTLDQSDYRQYGPNDALYVDEAIKAPVDFRQYMRLLKKGHAALTRYASNGEIYHILPSRALSLTVDSPVDTLGLNAGVSRSDAMVLHVSGSYLGKNALAILDLIASNDWQRTVYFNYTSLNALGLNLGPYLVQEGPVYRLGPEKHAGTEIAVDTQRTWENIVAKANYSNLEDPHVLLNYEDYHARILVPIRQSFNSLARTFLKNGERAMAEKVMQNAMAKLYLKHLRPSYTNIDAADILLSLEKPDMADTLSRAAFDFYYRQVNEDLQAGKKPDPLDVYIVRTSAELLAATGHPEFEKGLAKKGL